MAMNFVKIQMTLGSGIYVGWVGAATAIFVSVLYFMGMSFNCISFILYIFIWSI